MQASVDGQTFTYSVYANRVDLQSERPEVFEKIKHCVFYEGEGPMEQVAANFSVRIVDGDLDVAHPEDYDNSTFSRVLDAMGMDNWRVDFLVFANNLKLERSIRLGDRYEKVVVCGDLTVGGVVNNLGTLFVLGKATNTES